MRSEFAHRGHLGIGHHHGGVGVPHGERCAAFDPGRAVADHPVEPFPQLLDHPLDAIGGQRILVARLRGRQQRQVVDSLVADQCLGKLGVALNDVDQVEHHAPLRAHHQVQIAQPYIEVDDNHVLALLCQRGTERRRRCRLADAALSGCHDKYRGHLFLLFGSQSSVASIIASPASHACTGRPRSAALMSSAVW